MNRLGVIGIVFAAALAASPSAAQAVPPQVQVMGASGTAGTASGSINWKGPEVIVHGVYGRLPAAVLRPFASGMN